MADTDGRRHLFCPGAEAVLHSLGLYAFCGGGMAGTDHLERILAKSILLVCGKRGIGIQCLVVSANRKTSSSYSGRIISWVDFIHLGNLGLRIAQVAGFLAGARRKGEVDQRRLKETKGLFLILAGVPIDDTGGGARCTQITLELLRQNYWVVYLNRYPKWETQDAGVGIAHPNLYTYDLSEFYWDDFVERYGSLLGSRTITALVEMPHTDFLPLINKIEEKGGTIIYEMIDDWDSALGGEWYSREIEREIIRLSEGLIGTAPSLKERLEEISGRSALFLPNAVNSRLFNPERIYQRPADLPEADWVAMYVGALWGEWFDWDLLVGVARRYPEAAVVVIGDYRGQCPYPQLNLHFLGLKPQIALPGYLAQADVALIPWEVSPITQATSPLKLYEYLAMHTPVVAPELNPLKGIPGVRLAASAEEFIDIITTLHYVTFTCVFCNT